MSERLSMTDNWELLQRLDKDLRAAAKLLGRREARALTGLYYQIQEFRKISGNQHLAAKAGEPNAVASWVHKNMTAIENDIRRALDEFSSSYSVGQWMKSLTGIGAVIGAGMLAHIDISKSPTAGHIWRFAGYDPTVKWEKKQKRPWNADLKCLCFKLGDCFVKFSNHENQYYGTIYNNRKQYETARNDRFEYSDQAEHLLATKNFVKDTEARKWYEKGQLPPGHLHMRALRYASKMFLSHLHHVMHCDFYGREPPTPFALENCAGHTHFVPVPNWPFTGTGKRLVDMRE